MSTTDSQNQNNPEPEQQATQPIGGRSRYSSYEEHELLDMVSQYEDELRWSRMREGLWIALIAHIILFALLAWGPRYLLNHGVRVVNPADVLKDRKDLTYLDLPPDALAKLKPKTPAHISDQDRVAETKQPSKNLLDKLAGQRRAVPPQPVPPAPPAPQQQQQPAPPQQQQAQAQPSTPQPQNTQPLPLNQHSQLDGPRPSAVPSKPNFNQGSSNPAEQMMNDMHAASRSRGGAGISGGMGGTAQHHPGAAGGAEILSDTMGVDFGPYMQKLIRETYRTWDPLIPEEVNPPISKSGQVEVVFTILPNGRVADASMHLVGRSGDSALDRAAWGAIQGADYPPLPHEFHGPYLQLKFRFEYNMRPE